MSDPASELIACLDVLWEELHFQLDNEGRKAPPIDELHTALWQTPELVWRMADELARTHELIDDLAAEQVRARQKAQQVLQAALQRGPSKT